MSTDPQARLFYGYLQPKSDREHYLTLDSNVEDTAWSAIHTHQSHDCIGGLYGYDENLGFFLAVKKAFHVAAWDDVCPLTAQDFVVQPEWSEQLRQASEDFKLDLTGLEPGWYLACLYF